MKIKYYVEGKNGKVLVRTSANEYKYALVDINEINEGIKGIYCCSGSYDNIMKQYRYFKDVHEHNAKSWEGKDEERKAICEKALEGLKIVELVKGC